MQLRRKPDPLTPDVLIGPTTRTVVGPFDVVDRLDELIVFYPWEVPQLPATWGIGAIIGGSGSGKSLLVGDLGGAVADPVWHPGTAIADHFDPDDVLERFAAVGLNDVPTWCRPYQVLSNGQRFRADLARQIGDRTIIDEFTSVVSRPVAMSTCHGLRRWVDHNDVRCMIVASCHHDIEEWLRPDWVIDTDHGVFRDGPPGRRAWHAYPVAELRLELE